MPSPQQSRENPIYDSNHPFTMDMIYGKNRKPLPVPKDFKEPYYEDISELPEGKVSWYRNTFTGIMMLVDRTGSVFVTSTQE